MYVDRAVAEIQDAPQVWLLTVPFRLGLSTVPEML